MYAFSETGRNKITVAQLLTAYKGERGITEQIQKFFPPALNEQLFSFDKASRAAVRNGNAYKRFEECAEIFTDEHATEILSRWQNQWAQINAFDGDKNEITREECARRIINGERQLLPHELLDWLDNALKLGGDEYLQKIFAVLTILAITRDQNGERWQLLAQKLLAIKNFLSNVQVLDEEPSDDAQNNLKLFKEFYGQNPARAREFFNAALEDAMPIWNSHVWREWAKLQQNSKDKLQAYLAARKCLEDALRGNPTNNELLKHWRDTSEEFLTATIKFLAHGDETFAQEFEKPLHEENFLRAWYGNAYFRLAKFYQSRDEEKFTALLNHGVELNDHESLNLKMELLWQLDGGKNFAWRELAEILQNSPLPKVRGNAHWRLYLLTKDERHLQAAYEADYPDAIHEHNQGVVSYVEELMPAIYSESGCCLLNVAKDHHLAKIFLKTVPENWNVAAQENFYSEIEHLPPAQIVCLLIDDDAKKNLADFLTLLANMKKNPPPTSTVFIRGDNDLLTPIVNTALKQYYYEKNPPLLRVEILDDELDAVRKLFSRRPLFLPLLKKNSCAATTLHFVTVGGGEICSIAVREAKWFMTFPAELKITPKITTLKTFDDETLNKFAQDSVATDEALYFLVDIGDDLQNLSLAIKIREILTRAWLKCSKTAEPPFAPIAFRCENIDFAFMSRRLIVLGEEQSGGAFNNHFLTPAGLRYTWRELVNNLDSRLAVAVHMVYCGVHVDKNFSDKNCRKAFVEFFSRTYNQRSSLAVAQSLITRLFVMSSLLGIKIFDAAQINTENFLDESLRKKILADQPLLKSLKEFFTLLQRADKKSSELWNSISLSGVPSNSQALLKILDKLAAQIDYPALDDLKNFLDFKESCNRSEIPAQNILDKLISVREKVFKPRLEVIEKTFIWEHDRWSAYMRHSENWLPVTAEDAVRYINAGNNAHQQNFLAKLHPCIDLAWCHLKTLAQDLKPALGREKDFKGSDIESILATADLLNEKLFKHDAPAIHELRRLFCLV